MIDIVGKRGWFFLASLIIIIPGIIAIAAGGIKPNIDFTGGTSWDIKVQANTTTERVKQIMAENGHPEAIVIRATQPQNGQTITSMIIRTRVIEPVSLGAGKPSEKQVLADALTAAGILDGKLRASSASNNPATGTLTTTGALTTTGTTSSTIAPGTGLSSTANLSGTATTNQPASNNAELTFDTVGAAVGSEVTTLAFSAVAAASLGILLYLYYAFRKVDHPFRFGLCAVAAMLHDVLVVVGIFAILGLLFGTQIDSLFITALLTVVGFSVHDTIVVFDRIRENSARRLFPDYGQIVNHSLLQTLARSLNTSLTVIFTLLALYLFGGLTIRNFVLALLIGIISGTYSSIFNASLLLVVWEKGWGFGRDKSAPPPATSPRVRAA